MTKCKHIDECMVLNRFLKRYTLEEVNAMENIHCYETENPPCELYLVKE